MNPKELEVQFGGQHKLRVLPVHRVNSAKLWAGSHFDWRVKTKD